MNGAGAGSLLARIAWGVAGIVVVAAGIVFSIAFLAVGLVAGAIAYAWLAWKRRALGVPAREPVQPVQGRVIEGEAVSLPDDPR